MMPDFLHNSLGIEGDIRGALEFPRELPGFLMVVLLGLLAGLTGVVSREALEEAILERAPKGTGEMNLKALAEGFAAAEEAAQAGVLLVWEYEPGFWLNKPSEVVRAVKLQDGGVFRPGRGE